MATTIGFIGLGTMGAPMVRNLLKRGHAVTVWARRREAMTPLLEAGATAGESAAHAAATSDVIFFISLFQRWRYRTDYTRQNEFGYTPAAEVEAAKAKADAAAAALNGGNEASSSSTINNASDDTKEKEE